MSYKIISKTIQKIKYLFKRYDQSSKAKLSEALEMETRELENIFALLVLGFFVGLPAPPLQITLDLLPAMERELLIMLQRIETANAPLSELVSVFETG